MDPARPTPDPGAELIDRWQRNQDREALDDLLRIEIRQLKARLRAGGARSSDPSASVSDVAQEAVTRLLQVEPAPTFGTPQALRAYLWTAASRLLAERLRRLRGESRSFAETGTGALDEACVTSGGLNGVELRDRSQALATLVGLLEPGEQQILGQVYFRALSYEQAAEELGVTREVAKARCERARARLQHKLKHWVELIG